MLSFAIYALQVIICSAIMMLYYWLVLRNKRFHSYNRFYILSVFILSWLIPLGKIYLFDNIEKPIPQILYAVANGNDYLDEVIVTGGFHVDWWLMATIAYLLICLAFVGVFVRAVFIIYRLKKSNPKEFVHHFWLVFTNVAGTPFSFFKYVFWNNAVDINSSTGKQMLQHELVHVNEKHSTDSVLVQLILCVGWFNPFFWLAKKELNVIHEFIADKKSVENGDTANFAAMLLAAAYPQQQHLLTHTFFFSPIKRRLYMLTHNKKPKFSYMRRIIVLPLMAIVVLLFAFRIDKANKEKKLTEAKVLNAPLNNKISDSIPKKGDSVVVSMVDSSARKRDTVIIAGNRSENGNFSDFNNSNFDDVLFLVDGIKWDRSEMSNLNPKDKTAIASYGKVAKNGVISIVTKKDLPKKIYNDTVVVVGFKSNSKGVFHNYEKVFSNPQIPPSFPGGKIAWHEYLERNLDSNVPIKKGAPSGRYTVVVSFIVDEKGNVSNVKAENNPGYGTAEEAVWVIKSGPTWVPAVQNGHNVVCKTKQTITFVVAEEKFTPPKIVKDPTPKQYKKDFTTVQIPASFPGGVTAWQQYLERNLNADLPVKKGAPSGRYTVIISFIVDKNGNVSDVKNENNPGYGTAEEAVRVIKQGPAWVAAVQNGRKVICRHRQAITFKISDDK